jgi:hypothetical protein
MVELMVPREPEVPARIVGFYEQIGWIVAASTESEHLTYVSPPVKEGISPTVAYWQTESASKISHFEVNPDPEPSFYSRGLRLPKLQDLVEVCLVVPSDEAVRKLYERGDSLLEAHAHTRLREHAGRQEFRLADPFNYSLRVTADPGWEITKPKSEALLFDSAFVTIGLRSDSNEKVAFVDLDNLIAFAKEQHPQGKNTGIGKRTYNAIMREAASFGQFLEWDSEGKTRGLKPERLSELVSFISQRDLRDYGDQSRGLLVDLHTVLYPKETTS